MVKQSSTKCQCGTDVPKRDGWRFSAGHGKGQQMDRNKRKNPRAGGIWIAVGAVVGAIGGIFVHQPSLGLVLGVTTGTLLALTIWIIDRRG
jgi:hypothetical protein